MKAEERQLSQPERRPYDVNECSDIAKGAHWRDQIIQEIAKKMTLIQNGLIVLYTYLFFCYFIFFLYFIIVEALGEIKIRELNDSLNKLLLEKWKWEKRIFELGGTNYNDDPNPPKYQFIFRFFFFKIVFILHSNDFFFLIFINNSMI